MDKVMMVLGTTHNIAVLVAPGRFVAFTVLGIYRLDNPCGGDLQFASGAEALLYIRNHGGEWIAGEPLPEKPEEVWAQFRMYGRPPDEVGFRCGHCLGGWSIGWVDRCSICGAKLAKPQDWVGVKVNQEQSHERMG